MISSRAIKEFKEHILWKELEATLKEQVELRKEELVDIDPFKDPSRVCRVQGEIYGIESIFEAIKVIGEKSEEEEAQDGK